MPPHCLTLEVTEREVMRDPSGNRDVLAIIHATVNLIENLGMTSLAEGVETSAQAAVLHSLVSTRN
jgi:EAL domain-containing protein (putative c-di-GMP-specific phosphodiesterase class I)